VKKLDKTGFLKDNTDPAQFANDTYYDVLKN